MPAALSGILLIAADMVMKKAFAFYFSFLAFSAAFAGSPNGAVLDYIAEYKALAVQEMVTYHIPASITLAQGILESGAGLSELAKESNNHFGIKCHDDWNGDKVYYDDDAEDECFRKYPSVADSYEDHSEFLSSNTRYAFLFDYEITDYKKWAQGLKTAGYATNPKYADLLIGIIQDYGLNELDKMSLADVEKDLKNNPIEKKTEKKDTKKQPKENKDQYALTYYFNRIPAVTIKEGDTPEKIGKENNIWPKRLYEYNDLQPGQVLEPGTKFYLQPKRKTGIEKYHVVKQGETMWTISRDDGIKLSWLYKRNKLEEGQEPATGQKLNLRGKRKSPPAIKKEPVAPKTNTDDGNIKFLGDPEEEINSNEPKKPEIKETLSQQITIPEEKHEKIIPAAEETIDSVPAPVLEKSVPEKTMDEPQKTVPAPEAVKNPVYHEVQQKETMYSLSKQFGVTIEDLQKWNNMTDYNLKIGQELIVGYK